jgi:hypothetical protein
MHDRIEQSFKRILQAMAAAPRARNEILRRMAQDGAVSALRTILDEGLVVPPLTIDQDLHRVGLALLWCETPEGGAEAAKSLARDWLMIFGGGMPGLSLALYNLDHGPTARLLLALGADPNTIGPGQHRTAISDAYEREHLDVLGAGMEHCAKQNILPMRDESEPIFPSLFVGDEEYFYMTASHRFHNIPQWPESWRLELGSAMVDYLEKGGLFDLGHEAEHCCRLIANCELPAQRWEWVLSKIPLGTHLAKAEDLDYGNRREALQNLLIAGVDVNLPIATLRDGTDCSMFLAAAEVGNTETAMALLALGADPMQTVVRDGVEVGARELAEKQESMLALLASLTARKAMQAVTNSRNSKAP